VKLIDQMKLANGPCVTVRGERKNGNGFLEKLRRTPNIAGLIVAMKWKNGTRWCVVESDDGIELGGISRHPDTGKRVWWYEGDDGEASGIVAAGSIPATVTKEETAMWYCGYCNTDFDSHEAYEAHFPAEETEEPDSS